MAQADRQKPTVLDSFSARMGIMSQHRDVTFAIAICTVLAILFVPLPAMLLDIGLALSVSVSVLVLMVALWVRKPLEFSSFPTLLLIVTMMRLSLNVASSRLILSEGQTGTDAAGNVIQGIADFVVGGDYVIGTVMFCILVAINFIVITKGSTRIAEVAARFSLDAMPGKQMAIDADLGAGMINEQEARARRKEVEDESGFFGAMDGAAKFVRGDAVAGIIITLINVVGGILIGITRHGMNVSDALHNFTVLTIGDGLVTQIPALIVSIAAGIIVTKGATVGAANEAVTTQLSGNPKAMFVAAALTFLMGLLPGFPFLLFAVVAAVLVAFGLYSRETQRADLATAAEVEKTEAAKEAVEPEATAGIDTVTLEMGRSLIVMLNNDTAALPGKIKSLRDMFQREYGFLLPPVRIKDGDISNSKGYVVKVQGVEVAEGELRPGSRLVIDPAGEGTMLSGERVKEPTFGLPAVWIDTASAPEAEAAGFTVVDPESVIVTHLTETLKENMPEMMTYGVARELMNSLDPAYRKLIQDISTPTPVILFRNVLRKLLSERVSIRNLPLIAESIAEASTATTNATLVAEQVRKALSAQICKSQEGADGFIQTITLGGTWEQEFASTVKVQGDDTTCTMPPAKVQEFGRAARGVLQAYAAKDEWPALVVSPEYRPIIRSMLERIAPMTPILSFSEIHWKAKLKTVAQIGE
ncbi:flagellar biosynthesis protein FlhA [Neptunicoccus cionae]|uniref:flagellar biosynthesis protein FlhA n=1 Tax=Neptunicoccus cionae TaxID=2035344 RepID=UPI002570A6AE|nr:flagellar biosynthesis protein FlhA [Amylibacter cionae]